MTRAELQQRTQAELTGAWSSAATALNLGAKGFIDAMHLLLLMLCSGLTWVHRFFDEPEEGRKSDGVTANHRSAA